jgi:hypothetical protein
MATRKAAVVEEVEELEDDLELEDLDETIEDEGAEKKTRKKRADAPAFGINELCAHLQSLTDHEYTPREVRTLIRKMARDGSNRVNREISPDNRSRYSWSGPEDPEVVAISDAVTGGEIEADKKAALDALKQRKAQKDAEAAAQIKAVPMKKKAAAKRPAKKAASLPPVDDDDEVEDFDEDDE